MAKKVKRGRPKVKDKVKVRSAYLKDSEYTSIKKSYKSLSQAVRAEILPKCG